MKRVDLAGKTFGTWTAIRRVKLRNRSTWLCRCSCGIERDMPTNQLTRATPYCECSTVRREAKDIGNRTIGAWTAVRFIRFKKQKTQSSAIWLFRCECGTEREFLVHSIRSNGSCGCKRGTHRHSAKGKRGRTPTYTTWQSMISRCTHPSSPAYQHYKARGINVCKRWRKFENFLADMGERPDGLTLDRYPNNDGNYEPGNCRWASKITQANNRITNVRFDYRGKSYTLAELSRETGVVKDVLRTRLCRSKKQWTVEAAIHTPVIPRALRRSGG